MTNPTAGLRVLVVDDDSDTRANLHDILELDGYDVALAGSVAEALRIADWQGFFAIILDRRLPDGTAEGLLPRLKQLAPEAAVIIVTGYADLDGAIAAIRQGAADYILKPINADLIRSRLAGLAERRRAAREIDRLNTDLKHRVNELQALLEVLPVGIAIAHDPECQRVTANAALAPLLGDPLLVAPLRRAVQGSPVRGEEIELVRDGVAVNLYSYSAPLQNSGSEPRGAVAAFLDVTERKREQERLLQSERLAVIGQMVTGLAHESGNALARSLSCLEMLTWEVEDKPEALDLIKKIQQAQNHLKQLYSEVRSYAGPIQLEREPWELSAVWRQTWEHLEVSRQQRDALLCEDVDGLDLTLSIDPFRLDQVFRNIFENALAACPDPVRITVRCRDAALDGKAAVCVSIRDNGPGLDERVRQRIFEPFFTTKARGTGLGMAIARRIVEAHGGKIAVGPARSVGEGAGAELVVTLPRQV